MRTTRELVLPVYLPTILLAFGQGVMVPVLPLFLREHGASYSVTGIAIAAAWVGTLAADVPVGTLLGRLGHRRAFLVGCVVYALATLAVAFTVTAAPLLVLSRFVSGIGIALWGLSRHAYLATVVPVERRGRAIAVFGGINRIGWFLGPALGGWIGTLLGLQWAIVTTAIVALVALLVAALAFEPAGSPAPNREAPLAAMGEVLRARWQALASAGSAQLFGQMLRQTRQVAIPLYGADALGLSAAAIGQIISLSALVDMGLFWPAGWIMDRWGRKAAAVPSFLLLGLGMGLVPFTSSYVELLLVGLFIGFANGLGSGTMMTLGADLAPPGRTGEFLGLWRLVGDSGQAVAPLAVGFVADALGIAVTAGLCSGLGLLSAGMLVFLVPETRHLRPADQPARATAPSSPQRR
ncbi:MAG: MFS transporter [Thermomicrobium sp.]|nr:MFS transporter [Thermomicrobium sp.]MDW8060252.1 MFS transporter [Thermomicrobium sp.]